MIFSEYGPNPGTDMIPGVDGKKVERVTKSQGIRRKPV